MLYTHVRVCLTQTVVAHRDISEVEIGCSFIHAIATSATDDILEDQLALGIDVDQLTLEIL